MDTVPRDVRYALRSLRTSPGFTVVAVLLLALSVGASTAVFSIVDAVYFSAIPYRDPSRLVLLDEVNPRGPCPHPLSCKRQLTWRELDEWAPRLETAGADAVAGLSTWGIRVTSPAGKEPVAGAAVTTNFFRVLGVRPLLGRDFTADDARADAADVAVLSYAFWHSRFGDDTTVVGRSFDFNGRPFVVIGVMPASAAVGRPVFPRLRTSALFIPAPPLVARKHLEQPRYTRVVARLAPHGSGEAVRRALDVLLARARAGVSGMAATAADTSVVWRARVSSLRAQQAQAFASSFPIFLGATLFVALGACANLAGLFLARLNARRHEIATRAALGASSGHLTRQFGTEGMLIAAAGGVLGILVAYWGTGLARILLPVTAIPYWTTFTIDVRVAAFGLALAVVGSAIFGLGPALMLARRSTGLGLRDVSGMLAGARSTPRVHRHLVSIEVACTLVLLTGAGLLGKVFFDAATRDMGYSRRSVVYVGVHATDAGYKTPAQQLALARTLVERFNRIPGVEASAFEGVPQFGEPEQPGITREGDAAMIPSRIAPGSAERVSPDYFRAKGVPVLAGRAFTAADGPGAPRVAIISRPTAERLFPHGHAVGRRIKFGPPSSALPWMTIVGVVGGTRESILAASVPYEPQMYRPVAQVPTSPLGFIVHPAGADTPLVPTIRAAVRDVLPTAPLPRVTTIEDVFNTSRIAPVRLNAIVIGGLAIFALIIASLGVYGVIAYLVTERTREMGVRMALGASGPVVVTLVMRSALGMVLWGVAGGLAGSLLLTRVLRAFLYGVSPTDPRVFTAVAALLVIVALLAVYIPARRATRVDPMIALRTL